MTTCGVINCTNEATHTWSGHPTCDDCATPTRKASMNGTTVNFEARRPEFENLLEIAGNERNHLLDRVDAYLELGQELDPKYITTARELIAKDL